MFYFLKILQEILSVYSLLLFSLRYYLLNCGFLILSSLILFFNQFLCLTSINFLISVVIIIVFKVLYVTATTARFSLEVIGRHTVLFFKHLLVPRNSHSRILFLEIPIECFDVIVNVLVLELSFLQISQLVNCMNLSSDYSYDVDNSYKDSKSEYIWVLHYML